MAVADDVRTLQRLIKFIREVLEWLTRVLQGRNTGVNFIEVWPEVERRLNAAEEQIGRIRNEGDTLWQDLNAVGLTGNVLEMKLSVLERIVAPFRRASLSAAPEPPTGGRRPSRILKWVNSFLGSLKQAIPGVEFVKEYKEMVELTVEHRRNIPPAPERIFDLR